MKIAHKASNILKGFTCSNCIYYKYDDVKMEWDSNFSHLLCLEWCSVPLTNGGRVQDIPEIKTCGDFIKK